MTVVIVGVPTDFGANRRGVDMGPSAIRYAGLTEKLTNAGIEWTDTGDVVVPDLIESGEPAGDMLEGPRAVANRVRERIANIDDPTRTPLVVGGDHSISLGSLQASARSAAMGAIWFDAHGDFNTPETSPSGNVHGMALAGALGVGDFAQMPWAQAAHLRAENVVLIGTRDLDPTEAEAVRNSDVTVFTMSDIDTNGIADVCERAIARASTGVDGVHVSLDLDFLDPLEAPGVGTPVRGGVTYREAHLAMELVAESLTKTDRLVSMDVVEVNPIRDRSNRTAELATELVASAFGDRIL